MERLTISECPNFCISLDSIPLDSSWVAFGLNKCSNMAMIRNIDTKMAVATKPKEMALMDVPKFFCEPSLLTSVCDGLGLGLLYMFHDFDPPLLNSLIPVVSDQFLPFMPGDLNSTYFLSTIGDDSNMKWSEFGEEETKYNVSAEIIYFCNFYAFFFVVLHFACQTFCVVTKFNNKYYDLNMQPHR